MTLREFINTLSSEQLAQIIKDYEALERDKTTGDTLLRTTAENYLRAIGITSNAHILLHMEQVAKECFRYFALKYLKQHNL